MKEPREKAIRLIKAHKGDKWLVENAQWLEYDYTHIRNPTGKKGRRTAKTSKKETKYKELETEEGVSYEQGTQVLAGKLRTMSNGAGSGRCGTWLCPAPPPLGSVLGFMFSLFLTVLLSSLIGAYMDDRV